MSEESIAVGGGLIFLLVFLGAMALSLAGFVLWIWSLISAARNPMLDSDTRLIWILVIVFAGVLGSIVYLFVGLKGNGNAGNGNSFAKNYPPPHPPAKPY